jgi:hypothetical protein
LKPGDVNPNLVLPEVARLRATLEAAAASSTLAEEPTAREALHDLLLRIRLPKP